MKRLTLLFACFLISMMVVVAQNMSVEGLVIDQEGLPVIGASVVVKGTNNGATTDENGSFKLSNVSSSATLVISYLGMLKQEVPAKSNLVIELRPNLQMLDEIVVTGYGNVKRSDFTGSVSTVSTKAMEDVPSVSFSAKLAGAAAGIQAGAATGQPGAVEAIRIRGIGSINASNEPLYVLDGVPLTVGNASGFTYSQSGNSLLATLNSNDIESINIIKDAAAASLYGSRAANGVIIITTKRGSAGKTDISFKADWGQSDMAIDYRPTLGGDDRRELLHLGLVNYSLNQGKTDAEANTYADSQIDTYAKKPWNGWTDWRDYLLKTGKHQNYEFSIKGGNDKTQLYSSLAYTKMEGVTLQSGLERYTGRLNVDHKAGKFTFGANTMFTQSQQDVNSEGTSFSSPIMGITMTCAPSDFPYNEDGSFNITNGFRAMSGNALANPLYSAYLNYDKSVINRILSTVFSQYNFLPELYLKETISYDFNQTNNRVWWDPRSNDGRSSQGVYQRYMFNRSKLVTQSQLGYSKKFDLKHSVDLLAGYETEDYQYDYTYSNGNTYPTYLLPEIANSGTSRASSSKSGYRLLSFVGRINYSFDSKYYLGASFRRDGTSRLAPATRWGNFWSLSGSWRISEETFLESIRPIVTDARLRASYGINGTYPNDYYEYMGTFGYGYRYNGVSGSAEEKIPNENLKWEENHSANIGIDLTFINRISLVVDLYNRTSKDLLIKVPASRTTGFENYMQNIGEMTNKGIEVDIKTTNILRKDFIWTTGLNFAHNENKLVKLDGIQTELANANSSYLIGRVGEAYNSFYVFEYAGVDPKTGKESFYKNREGVEREITTSTAEADRVIVGNSNPTLTGGITNSLTWKNIQFLFTFTYSLGGHAYDLMTWLQSNGGTYHYNGNIPSYYDINKVWQKEGDNAELPRFVYGNVNAYSSRWMLPTDHLRLKNVTLGYQLPNQLTKKVGLEKIRVYGSAANLLTFKSSKLYIDPELPVNPSVSSQMVGMVRAETPALRTVTFGIEIGF